MSKSPNRIMDAIYSGKPVITNEGVNSYYLLDTLQILWLANRLIMLLLNGQAFKALINKKKDEIITKIIRG